MIDKKAIRKNPWRFILPAPILILLFSAFTFACIQPATNEVSPDILAEPVTESVPEPLVEDSLKMKIIDPYAGSEATEIKWYQNSVIAVLFNRNSEVMIAKVVTDLQDVEQKIISEYNKRLEDKEVTSEIKVYVSKDIKADKYKYQSLLEDISSALLKIRDMQSVRLYGNIYNSLEEDEKLEIEKQVPYRVYGNPPRQDRL